MCELPSVLRPNALVISYPFTFFSEIAVTDDEVQKNIFFKHIFFNDPRIQAWRPQVLVVSTQCSVIVDLKTFTDPTTQEVNPKYV